MKILIIGLGSIASKHIKALHLLNIKAELFALRFQRDSKEENGVKNLFSESELDDDYDFAIISNPTNLHFKAIDLLIEKFIPLFIEKPPLASLKGAEELNTRLIKLNIKTYVACNLRFHPCIIYLKQFISSNNLRVNEVNVYCGSYLPDWRPEIDYRDNYSANKNQGGGVHLDLFHELDYVHWIFGQPQSVKSYKTSCSSLKIDAIDYANYTLKYQTFSVSVILNYYRRTPKRTIEVLIDDKTVLVDLINNEINEDGKVLFSDPDFQVSDTYIKQMDFFINKVLSDKTQMNTFTESIQILKNCLHDK